MFQTDLPTIFYQHLVGYADTDQITATNGACMMNLVLN